MDPWNVNLILSLCSLTLAPLKTLRGSQLPLDRIQTSLAQWVLHVPHVLSILISGPLLHRFSTHPHSPPPRTHTPICMVNYYFSLNHLNPCHPTGMGPTVPCAPLSNCLYHMDYNCLSSVFSPHGAPGTSFPPCPEKNWSRLTYLSPSFMDTASSTTYVLWI